MLRQTHNFFFFLPVSCPFVKYCARSLDITRWKGSPETRLWALRPGICLSLLYSLSPTAPLWPADPLLQAALPAMSVPAELHDSCPLCSMVEKTSVFPEGLGDNQVKQLPPRRIGSYSLLLMSQFLKCYVSTLLLKQHLSKMGLEFKNSQILLIMLFCCKGTQVVLSDIRSSTGRRQWCSACLLLIS